MNDKYSVIPLGSMLKFSGSSIHLWDGKADGMSEYEVVPNSRKRGLSNKGYNRTDKTPLGGSNNLNQIILRKKSK